MIDKNFWNFEAVSWELAKNLRSLQRFIRKMKGQSYYYNRMFIIKSATYLYLMFLSWKIVSGQLSKLAALSDPKSKKRPNFFFKTAKLVDCLCKKCQNNPSGNYHTLESANLVNKHGFCVKGYFLFDINCTFSVSGSMLSGWGLWYTVYRRPLWCEQRCWKKFLWLS